MPRTPTAERAKDACATAFCTNCVLALVEGVLSLGGPLWPVVRIAVTVWFTVALVVWLGLRLRAAGRPSPRAWAPALLLAAAVTTAAALVSALAGAPGGV